MKINLHELRCFHFYGKMYLSICKEKCVLARSYDKLWKLLIDKKMMRTELREAAGISTNALAKLGKNESVQLQTLEKICAVLDCDLSDIVEINI